MLATNQSIYHFGEFHLETSARLLARKGQRVPLGSKAFEVLLCLVRHAGEVVTKDVLLKTVWPNSFVEDNNLSQHIFSLRKALTDRADLIVTVPGRGYQFTGRVLEITPAVPKPHVAEHPAAVAEAVVERVPVADAPVAVAARVAEVSTDVAVPGRGWTRRWMMWGGPALAVLALVVWGGWMRPRAAAKPDRTTIVLADFGNTTGDGTFDRTLQRALAIELEQSPKLEVVSERQAMMVLESMGSRSGEAVTPEVARAICERAQGQILVAGSIASMGEEYLLTVQATDCKTGKGLAGAKAEAASKEKVLGALDRIADRVGAMLDGGADAAP